MDPNDPVGGPLEDIAKILKIVSQVQARQIWSQDIRSHLKAVGFAWFNSYHHNYLEAGLSDILSTLDSEYKTLISAAEGCPQKTGILGRLKKIQNTLKQMRSQILGTSRSASATSDSPPPFSALVADPFMQDVLLSRWKECISCISANAPVAAIVMMGGLLESLLLARVNRETSKQPIFLAKSAPRDKTGTPRLLKDWVLRDYIDVAHELQWISKSARDVSDVLRDYRNYIHPYKQVSSQTTLTGKDALVLWEVFKTIARQLS